MFHGFELIRVAIFSLQFIGSVLKVVPDLAHLYLLIVIKQNVFGD